MLIPGANWFYNCIINWNDYFVFNFSCRNILFHFLNLPKNISALNILFIIFYCNFSTITICSMGYSFIFSALFAAGITYIMLMLQRRISSPMLGFIAIPCISGILILSIRISMLHELTNYPDYFLFIYMALIASFFL